eukprot:1059369-Amphidinium_carterae.1
MVINVASSAFMGLWQAFANRRLHEASSEVVSLKQALPQFTHVFAPLTSHQVGEGIWQAPHMTWPLIVLEDSQH